MMYKKTNTNIIPHNKKKNKVVVILGPTASGKSDLALKLARKFNGEIICADSRQVYSEMAIGTASPFQNQKSKVKSQKYKSKFKIREIPHHIFHIVSPKKTFSVAQYQKLTIKTIKDIQKWGKVPFLVGGTGLYIKAIVDNLHFPKLKPSQKLRNELERKTCQELFIIYKKLDPHGAKQIDKNNKRRLVRAIEVCKITGQPFWAQRQKAAPLFDILQIGVDLPKPELEKRIYKRVEKMFKQGLEKEVKNLVKKYGWTKVLQNTIGYSEWGGCKELNSLQSSARSLTPCKKNEVKNLISLHTIQFAKRQMTWFKKDGRILWVKNYQETAQKVLAFIHNQNNN